MKKPRADDPRVTLVTALYDIGRDTLDGRKWDDYLAWFSKTLQVNCPMVVFCEPATKAFVEQCRGTLPTVVHTSSLDQIPLYSLKPRIADILASEYFKKNIYHLNGVEFQVPEYCIIQYSKLEWLKRAVEENAFGTEYFFWIDAGFSRFFFDGYSPSTSFPQNLGVQILKNSADRFVLEMKFRWFISEVHSKELGLDYLWSPNAFMPGCYFGGSKQAVLKARDKIIHLLHQEMLEKGLINVEQIAFCFLMKKYPKLFYTLYNDTRNMITLFHRMASHHRLPSVVLFLNRFGAPLKLHVRYYLKSFAKRALKLVGLR